MWSEDRQVKWAKKLVKRLDKKYFDGFFSDKDIKIVPNRRLRTTSALAFPVSMKIEYSPKIFAYWSMEEIKDTFLHELLHIFLYTQQPSGNAWDDDSPIFREWSRKFRCPPTGALIEKHPNFHPTFRICIDCDNVYDFPEEMVKKTRVCPDCGSSNTKFYRRRKV